jgi:DNA-binding MarR family transcriptional regulator
VLTTRSDLERLDQALVRLRRVWESPARKRSLLDRLGKPVEMSQLRTLRAIESAEGPPGVRDVADVLGVDSSTASRFVEQAVAAGHVSRTMSARDRRRCVLALTEEGKALLDEVTAVRTQLLAELTGDWAPDDIKTLSVLLERLAQ